MSVNMKKKFFFKQFLGFLLPLTLLLLLFGTPAVLLSWSYSTRVVNDASSALLMLAKVNFESIFDESALLLQSLDENVRNRVDIKDFFYSSQYTYEKIRTYNYLINTINVPANVREYVHSIYVYLDNAHGHLVVSNIGLTSLSKYTDKAWYESYLSQDPRVERWAQRREVQFYAYDDRVEKVVTVYIRFKHMPGVVVLNIRNSSLEKMSEATAAFDEQRLLVATDAGETLFSTGGEVSFADFERFSGRSVKGEATWVEGKRYVVSSVYNPASGWNFISMVPYGVAYRLPSTLFQLIALAGLLAIALSSVVALFQVRRNYRRLSTISEMFSAAEKERTIPDPAREDPGDIYDYIMQSIMRVFLVENDLKLQLIRHTLAEEKAQLQALQLQLNPHFMYNTLEYVNQEMLSMHGKQTRINDMVRDLSSLLRYALRTRFRTVPLYEEIENTQRYLNIMQYRYEGKIRALWECGSDMLEYTVLKFILQPLVENAILHGLQDTEEGIEIRIGIVETDGDMMEVCVSDTGGGMEEETLDALRSSLRKPDGGEHIGLFNLNRRLELMYGRQCSLKIESKPHEGTTVCLKLPLSYEQIA